MDDNAEQLNPSHTLGGKANMNRPLKTVLNKKKGKKKKECVGLLMMNIYSLYIPVSSLLEIHLKETNLCPQKKMHTLMLITA